MKPLDPKFGPKNPAVKHHNAIETALRKNPAASAPEIHKIIKKKGYRGSVSSVRYYANRVRDELKLPRRGKGWNSKNNGNGASRNGNGQTSRKEVEAAVKEALGAPKSNGKKAPSAETRKARSDSLKELRSIIEDVSKWAHPTVVRKLRRFVTKYDELLKLATACITNREADAAMAAEDARDLKASVRSLAA